LGIAAFTHADCRSAGISHDTQVAFWHSSSLAHPAGGI
jgi:hypothetical protein